MLKENLTFNDLPEVVGKLCERIESLENALKDNLAKQAPAKENLHVPMTVEEVMQLPWNIQVILLLQGQTRRDTCHQAGEASVVYRDELDKWLETGRKKQVPLSSRRNTSRCLLR